MEGVELVPQDKSLFLSSCSMTRKVYLKTNIAFLQRNDNIVNYSVFAQLQFFTYFIGAEMSLHLCMGRISKIKPVK